MASIAKYKRKDGQEAYRIQYTDHLGRRRSQVVVGDKPKAKATAMRIEVRVQDIVNGLIPPPTGSAPIGRLVRRYLKYVKKEGKSPATVVRYTTSLDVFLDEVGENQPIGKVTHSDIAKFKTSRLDQKSKKGGKIKPTTVNIDLRHIRAFLNYCVRMGFLQKSPYTGIKQAKVSKRDVRFLLMTEVQELQKVIREHDDEDAMDLLLFYLNTGARANEILPPRFTWDNVKDNYIELNGKGDKTRRVGMNETLRRILSKRKELEVPFPFRYEDVYGRIVRKYYAKASIKNANLHTLRKTAGALLIQQGVDIYRVSRFLGHTSVTVTEKHYVDLLQGEYADMTAAIECAISQASEVSEIPPDKLNVVP